MKLEMLVIRDAKTEAFMTPFFAQSVGAAERMFGDLLREPQEPVAKHPEDYALFWLGSFDPSSGVVEVKAQAVMVAQALSLAGSANLELRR